MLSYFLVYRPDTTAVDRRFVHAGPDVAGSTRPRRLRLRRGKQMVGCRAMLVRLAICLRRPSPARSPCPFPVLALYPQ